MAEDDAYAEIRVRGDFTEFDREMQRRQSADPKATVGAATFGTEGLRGAVPSAQSPLALTPLTVQGGVLPSTGPSGGAGASERLDAAINRLAAILEARGGGLGGGGGGYGGGWGGGGVPPGMEGPTGPFGFSAGMPNNPWVTAIPPQGPMGTLSSFFNQATIGSKALGPSAPPWLTNPWSSVVGMPNQRSGIGAWTSGAGPMPAPAYNPWASVAGMPNEMTGAGMWTSGIGSATIGAEQFGPLGPQLGPTGADRSMWYNRVRPALASAWHRGNQPLSIHGRPISNSLMFNAMFGAWEVQQARHAIAQGEFAFGVAETDVEALTQLNQGIQTASRGPLGSIGSMALDAFGVGPTQLNNFTMGEVARSKYLDRAQQNMQSLIVTRRQIGASDLGGISQKMEEAKLDRDIEIARNDQTVRNLKSAQTRLEATAASPEAFAVLDVVGQSIKAQQALGPSIEAQYQARLRQLGRDTRTQGIMLAGRGMLALNTLRGGGSQEAARQQLANVQAAEMSSAGFLERMALAPVHALERAALAKEQGFETHDIGFDLETREVRARMHEKGANEEQMLRYEFGRKQQFEMEQTVRNNPQNAMQLRDTQQAEAAEFNRFVNGPALFKAEQRALTAGQMIRGLDRSTEVLGVRNPHLRDIAAANARYADESEALSRRTDISQTQKSAIEDAMERRHAAEISGLQRDYAFYRTQTNRSFDVRSRALDAELARDPVGAQAIQLAGAARAEATRYRQADEEGYAQLALGLGIKQERLLMRNYLEAFRGEQINLNEITPTNPRDSENPTDVLNRIEAAIQDIINAIPQAD
jgi:hypothetical protein